MSSRKGKSTLSLMVFILKLLFPKVSSANSAWSIKKRESRPPLRELIAIFRLLTSGSFLFLVQETPMFALQVMKVMANRLRRIDLIIAKSDFERATQGAEG